MTLRQSGGLVAVALCALAPAPGCICGSSSHTAAPYTGEVIVRAEPKPEAEWLACTADADCTTFSDGCCGCTGGGKALAIAKSHTDDYDGLLAFECGATVCPTVMSTDPSCRLAPHCEAGKCVLGTGAGAVGTAAPGTAAATAAGTGGGSAGPAPGSAAGSAPASPAPATAK
jgi:hypothetical protein